MRCHRPLLGLLLLLAGCGAEPPEPGDDGGDDTLRSELGGEADAGFARADEPRAFDFPRDHGPHPGFRNEWWYVVATLTDDSGARYGVQATLFRIGLVPGDADADSAWATNQIWMGHLAVTAADSDEHRHAERFARDGAIGLAGAEADGRRVWLEDWVLARPGEDQWTLTAATGDFAVELDLEAERAPVLHGDDGLSQKSGERGNASYYYSIPRLAATGRVRLDDSERAVTGSAWLDREWSTSALGEAQAGWDWFALQLDDGTDIMVYAMRRRDGARSDYTYAAIMHPDGRVERLEPDDVRKTVTAEWTAPSGVTYPARWRLDIAGVDGPLEIEPWVADQEFAGSVRYWEGAVDVHRDGDRVGRGYVELTGYDAQE